MTHWYYPLRYSFVKLTVLSIVKSQFLSHTGDFYLLLNEMFLFESQNTCTSVYTKDRTAKCKIPALDLLIKVILYFSVVYFYVTCVTLDQKSEFCLGGSLGEGRVVIM